MKIIRGEFKEKLDLLFAPSIKAARLSRLDFLIQPMITCMRAWTSTEISSSTRKPRFTEKWKVTV